MYVAFPTPNFYLRRLRDGYLCRLTDAGISPTVKFGVA